MNDESLVNLRHWKNIISRGRWLIIGCTLSVMILAGIFTFTRIPMYEASSRLYLTPQQVRTLTFGDLFAKEGSRLHDRILTQMEIIQSWVTLQKAVASLEGRGIVNFDVEPPPETVGLLRRIKRAVFGQRERPPSTPQSRRIKFTAKLARSLNIQSTGGRAFLSITVRYPDPTLAAEMANAVATAYVAHDRDLRQRTAEEAINWLTDRVRDQRDKLLAAEEQMRQISPESSPSQQQADGLATQEMNQLQQALLDVRLRILEVEARNAQQESADGATPPAPSSTEDINAEVDRQLRERIRRDLVDTTVALRQLRQRYGDNHPDVLMMAEKEAQLRKSLEALGPAPNAAPPPLLTGSDTRLADLGTLKTQETILSDKLSDLIEANSAESEDDLQSAILARELDLNRSLYNEMLSRLNEITISAGVDSPTAEMFELAGPPEIPVSPDHRRNLLLGIFGGLLIGLGGAVVRDHLDESIRTPTQANDLLKAPVLGVIPYQPKLKHVDPARGRPLLLHADRESATSEAYRVLRSHIEARSVPGEMGVLLVTSALPGEGKTTTAVNLAAAFAEIGDRVLLIDGDFRRGHLGEFFGIRNGDALSRVLGGKGLPQQSIHKTSIPGIDLLSSKAGSRPPDGVRLTKAFEDLLHWARGHYSHIVIDTPVVMLVPGVAEMARAGGSLLLVHRPGWVPTKVLEQVVDHLALSRTDLTGIVLNAVRSSWVSHGYPLLPYYGTTHRNKALPGEVVVDPEE